MVPVFHPELPEPFCLGNLARWNLLRIFLKSRHFQDQHSRWIEKQDAKNPVELFDS